MKTYPTLNSDDIEDIAKVVSFITRERGNDITEANNYPNIYVRGRKVQKIPVNSSDVVSTDKIGDFNVTASFAYYLIDNGGTAEWRRVAVGVF